MVAPSNSIPLNNGLTKEQNDQAMNAIQKLKVHELSSIISQVNLRRPRAAKSEQQKTLMTALFDPQHALEVWRLAVQLHSGYGYEMPRRAPAQPVRPSPYSVPSRGTTMANHQLSQYQPQGHLLVSQAQIGQPSALRRADNGVLQQRVQPAQAPRVSVAQSFDPVPLPFYDVVATVLAPVELPPSTDRNGQKQTKQLQFPFQLNSDQMSKIAAYRNDSNPVLPRYEVQLRFFNTTEINGELKDDFPLNAFARCDDATVSLPNVIPTNKPNVEPKRPSRPVNITPYISRYQASNHRLTVEWLADKRSWAVSVIFVHRVDSQILFDRLDKNAAKHKSVELTKREIIDKLTGGGEDDIAMDHLKISLLDPLVKTRMKTPSRCKDCTHLQCFDLLSYLMMNERKPTWMCPVCSKYCPYDRLIVDDYFHDMLSQVDQNTTEVELKQDGSFDVIGRDDEVCLSDDDDNDYVELKPVTMNNNGHASTANGTATTATSNGAAESTNGGKRKKPVVADDDIIVLSDDDDDDLNRGIQNSLNDLCRPDRTGSSKNDTQKTPPPKSKRMADIEIITLDDTPPRPTAQPQQQAPPMSVAAPQPFRQNSVPIASSSAASSSFSTVTSSAGGMTTLSDALSQISNPRPATQPPQQQQQQQQTSQQHQLSQQAILQQQQNAYAAAVAAQQQFGFTNMAQSMMSQQQPQSYQLQNGLIGRSNQMATMQTQPPTSQQQSQQQQQQQMMSPQQFYGQPQMNGTFYYQQYQQYRQN